jgi:hypothetical protein
MPEACYCADVDVSVCAGLDAPAGKCVAPITAGAETNMPTDVTTRLGDPAYATGLAVRLIQCEQRYCAKSCGLCAADATSCADMAATGGAGGASGAAGSDASGAGGASGASL